MSGQETPCKLRVMSSVIEASHMRSASRSWMASRSLLSTPQTGPSGLLCPFPMSSLMDYPFERSGWATTQLPSGS
jgi:hypothetical protein